MRRGALIVIEGADGAGTTTQTERLVDSLGKREVATHATCQPSDGRVGKLLRQILRGEDDAGAEVIALLFAADRLDHIEREVVPALQAGTPVISDRWYHSSLAYQGLDVGNWARLINERALRPDLTVFLDVSVETALARRQNRQEPAELYDAIDKQRQIAKSYHQAIQSLRGQETIEVIDGEVDADTIAEQIFNLVLPLVTSDRAREYKKLGMS